MECTLSVVVWLVYSLCSGQSVVYTNRIKLPDVIIRLSLA